MATQRKQNSTTMKGIADIPLLVQGLAPLFGLERSGPWNQIQAFHTDKGLANVPCSDAGQV